MRIIILILTITSFSCGQTANSLDRESNLGIRSKDKQLAVDTVDYCTICDSLDKWQGGIQGVKTSDSTGPYPFAECHTNRHFDLIWVPKGDILQFKSSIGRDSLFRFYDKSTNDNFQNLDCYSFVVSKTKHIPDQEKNSECDCEDLDTYDYIFPSTVKIFRKTEKTWTHISTQTVDTFEELGRLKLNTIFNIK